MGFDQQKLIRTLRLSITCILMFLVTWYYQVPESVWCLLTIWVVMFDYNTVGGVLNKSLLRLSGTFLSAVYGMVIVYFCANNPVINIIALVPGLFIYSYFFMGGDKTYIGTIGAMTLTIVLLNYNDTATAVIRVLDILIGIIASVIMIRFFYPSYARNAIIEELWILMDELSTIIESTLDNSKSLDTIKEDYMKHDRKMLRGFTNFRRLIQEAEIETKKTPLFITHNISALNHIRKIFRLLSVFIYDLNNEEIRSDTWIIINLQQLLMSFRSLQNLLEHAPQKPITDSVGIDLAYSQPINFIELIFTPLQREVVLLTIEVQKIMTIHDEYEKKLVIVKTVET